ncbi:hypothetical protein CSA37_04770 [Candidatus Fermentibacteria bacterium]|nr:MAG: hypothetical protein CSA37_04770 [Candidatus Fermentibacteria bacterium]
MSLYRIAVRLKAPDPEAVTSMNAIHAMDIQLPPVKLFRYFLWEFHLTDGDKGTVEEMAGHFTDIVNPNKHLWTFAERGVQLPGQTDDLKWSGVVVSDIEDSTGENWTAILKRRGFPVEKVSTGVLWLFGYLQELDDSLVEKLVSDLSVSTSRSAGLLSNPVFQEVRSWA